MDKSFFIIFLCAAIIAPAQTLTTLVSFNGTNGAYRRPSGCRIACTLAGYVQPSVNKERICAIRITSRTTGSGTKLSVW